MLKSSSMTRFHRGHSLLHIISFKSCTILWLKAACGIAPSALVMSSSWARTSSDKPPQPWVWGHGGGGGCIFRFANGAALDTAPNTEAAARCAAAARAEGLMMKAAQGAPDGGTFGGLASRLPIQSGGVAGGVFQRSGWSKGAGGGGCCWFHGW